MGKRTPLKIAMSDYLILGKKKVFKKPDPIPLGRRNGLLPDPMPYLFETDFDRHLPQDSKRFFYGNWFFHLK
jgi:hypothetical protein